VVIWFSTSDRICCSHRLLYWNWDWNYWNSLLRTLDFPHHQTLISWKTRHQMGWQHDQILDSRTATLSQHSAPADMGFCFYRSNWDKTTKTPALSPPTNQQTAFQQNSVSKNSPQHQGVEKGSQFFWRESQPTLDEIEGRNSVRLTSVCKKTQKSSL